MFSCSLTFPTHRYRIIQKSFGKNETPFNCLLCLLWEVCKEKYNCENSNLFVESIGSSCVIHKINQKTFNYESRIKICTRSYTSYSWHVISSVKALGEICKMTTVPDHISDDEIAKRLHMLVNHVLETVFSKNLISFLSNYSWRQCKLLRAILQLKLSKDSDAAKGSVVKNWVIDLIGINDFHWLRLYYVSAQLQIKINNVPHQRPVSIYDVAGQVPLIKTFLEAIKGDVIDIIWDWIQ